MTKGIGGYFELELNPGNGFPHDDGVIVNSGRCALEYILKGIGNIRCLFVPLYTCEVVLEPIMRLSIPYEWYHINQNLEVDKVPELKDGDFILINNYFGIKDAYIKELCHKLADHVIVDNSQAFLTPQYNNQPTFWSPRKFVGVPDGGIAKPKYDIEITDTSVSYGRCSHLLKRWDLGPTSGYSDFLCNDDALIGTTLKKMSNLTQALLGNIDYCNIINKRKANYTTLRDALQDYNKLETPEALGIACPMVYPFYAEEQGLRDKLIENKIFVAKYWPNVSDWVKETSAETMLVNNLLPLPIDQRYTETDMKQIISILKI